MKGFSKYFSNECLFLHHNWYSSKTQKCFIELVWDTKSLPVFILFVFVVFHLFIFRFFAGFRRTVDRNIYHSFPRMLFTKIGLISSNILKFASKLFLKVLLGIFVAHDMPCALEKLLVPVKRHIQSQMSCIFDNVTVFAGLFITQLLQCLSSPILAGCWVILIGIK